MRFHVSSLLPLTILATSMTPAYADHIDEVSFEFSGLVTRVAEPLSSEFSVGEAVEGRFAVDIENSLLFGRDFHVNIGGDYSLKQVSANLRVGSRLVNLDVYPPRGDQVNGHVPEYFSLNLPRNRFSVLTGFPPGTLPSSGDRSSLRFDENDSLTVRFTVHRFEVVPEPSSGTTGPWLAVVILLAIRRLEPSLHRHE